MFRINAPHSTVSTVHSSTTAISTVSIISKQNNTQCTASDFSVCSYWEWLSIYSIAVLSYCILLLRCSIVGNRLLIYIFKAKSCYLPVCVRVLLIVFLLKLSFVWIDRGTYWNCSVANQLRCRFSDRAIAYHENDSQIIG